MMTLDRMLPLLRCPHDFSKLTRIDSTTLRSEHGKVYPIINNKPIMVKTIEPFHITPPSAEIISKNVPDFRPPADLPNDTIVVHLGCGDVPSQDPRVISVDILPTSAADIVAEAEHLPLQTGCVDYLVSGAVFEHVYDPIASAKEVRRILKEGGKFYIDTAFMQGYHGFPSHFFNMTPQAIETFIVDDFVLEHSTVPPMATCAHLFLEVQHRMLENMPPHLAQELLEKPFREVIEIFRKDETFANPYISGFSEYARRALAASFVVVGRKPRGYDQRDPAQRGESERARRAYYAARMGAIAAHGEIVFYRTRCLSAGKILKGDPIPDLYQVLQSSSVQDTSAAISYAKATDSLNESIRSLIAVRNQWLDLYCT